MPDSIHTDSAKRHDFVLLFDVADGNPNGDPDADNLPRLDPQTMHGLVTDVCLKRKVRDYVHELAEQPIFIQSSKTLNARIEEAAEAVGAEKNGKVANLKIQERLMSSYFDIRLFGAVLSTTDDYNAGQVRGPVQLVFARSIDPILPLSVTITRQARTTEERAKTGSTEMGRKSIVPYGLYRGHGFFSPHLAKRTGVSEDDLRLFWEALWNMFEHDRSAARGQMAMREVFVFTHDKPRGNAHAHRLFDLIDVARNQNGQAEANGEAPARAFSDYTVAVNEENLPKGVTLTRLSEVL